LEKEGHDKKAAMSALGKLANIAARRHTLLSSHPGREKRAQLMLSEALEEERATRVCATVEAGQVFLFFKEVNRIMGAIFTSNLLVFFMH
jgi:hypothetical protein